MSGARKKSGAEAGASGSRRPSTRSPEKFFREQFRYPKIGEMATDPPTRLPEYHVPEVIELGNFSRVGERDHVDGFSKSAYLIEPESYDKLNWDLNVAFDTRVPKDPAVIHKIDHLLRWITENFGVFQVACEDDKPESLHTEFVCYRSLLANIICSVHERSKGWVMGATRYRDTVYMCQYKPGRRSLYTDEKRRRVAWRHKFEQFLTSNRAKGKPTPQAPANENEVTYTVARSRVSKHHTIIFASRVVAIDPKVIAENPDAKNDTRRFVDLKVTPRVDTDEKRNLLMKRALKWWSHAKLLGIPRIICGFRDDGGIVGKIRSFSLNTLEEVGRSLWTSSEAIVFLNLFLDFVLKHNYEENRRQVVLYEYNPETRRIRAMLLPNTDPNYKKYQVLPEWYIDEMEESLQPERE